MCKITTEYGIVTEAVQHAPPPPKLCKVMQLTTSRKAEQPANAAFGRSVH
jgi:hypothetical protein